MPPTPRLFHTPHPRPSRRPRSSRRPRFLPGPDPSCPRRPVRRAAWAVAGVTGAAAALVLLLPAAGAALQGAPSCPEPSRGAACELRTFEVDLPEGRLQVPDVGSGSVSVEGWDGDRARVQARITARSRMGRSAASIAEEVEVEARPGRIETSGPDGTFRGGGWTVSYWIQVPRGTELELEVTNGQIQVREVGGPVAAVSTNGRLRLDGVDGWVRARTTNGSVDVAFREGGRLGQPADVQATNGSITLNLPRDLNANLRASTVNGSITGNVLTDPSGQRGNREAAATLGAGGPEIALRTTNGAIRVRMPD